MSSDSVNKKAFSIRFWTWELHWQILLGMVLGLLIGFAASKTGNSTLVNHWIAPFGDMFVNALKLIAIPLILVSLIKGVSDLTDLSRLSSMGGRTVVLYLLTTVISVTLGLVLVNVWQPGKSVSTETRESLEGNENTKIEVQKKVESAAAQKEKGPLQPLVDVVPDNLFSAASSNRNMLQIIFWAIFFGVGLILVDHPHGEPVKAVFDGLNEVILKMIDLIMICAPVGVFALMAKLLASTSDWDILLALLQYGLCVVVGLALMVFVVYPLFIITFTKKTYGQFFNAILPAQLLAFTTSSSAATLPVTMERVEEHLGVDDEVASFVLPIGATVNMDGTSLYQAVAAVFIAQVTGIELDFYAQLTIVTTATLASIGSAAVPGAGMVMLVIVLGAIGVPESGLAIIFAVDRILDMCRTTVNVTGDATVATIVASSLGKLTDPHVKNWDDNYPPDEEYPEPGSLG